MSINNDTNESFEKVKALEELVESLRASIRELEKRPVTSYEDKLRLAVLDRAPFTLWACDQNFRIVLWTGKCDKNYGYSKRQAIGKDFIDLFVSEPEKAEARQDTLEIIKKDLVFHNFIAEDTAANGAPRYMLTNCFRIWDEENHEWLQAEVALEISDIEEAIKQHRNLREAGIALVAHTKRFLELEQKDLSSRVRISYEEKINVLRRKQETLDGYITRLIREGRKEVAETLRNSGHGENQQKRNEQKKRMEELLSKIASVEKMEDCRDLELAVESYEKEEI